MSVLSVKQMFITKNFIQIAPCESERTVDLNVKFCTQIHPPRESSNKTVFFDFGIIIKSQDSKQFYIEIESQFIFEFDEIPERFDNVFSEKCKDLAFKNISDKIDSVLKLMNCPQLDIYSLTQK